MRVQKRTGMSMRGEKIRYRYENRKINVSMIECRHKLYVRLYEGVGQNNQWIEKAIFEKCG